MAIAVVLSTDDHRFISNEKEDLLESALKMAPYVDPADIVGSIFLSISKGRADRREFSRGRFWAIQRLRERARDARGRARHVIASDYDGPPDHLAVTSRSPRRASPENLRETSP